MCSASRTKRWRSYMGDVSLQGIGTSVSRSQVRGVTHQVRTMCYQSAEHVPRDGLTGQCTRRARARSKGSVDLCGPEHQATIDLPGAPSGVARR